MLEKMVYYSQLIGKPVIDKNFRVIGRVRDLAFIDGYKSAKISAIICQTKKGVKKIPWHHVVEIGDKINDTRFKVGVYLNEIESDLRYLNRQDISLNSILDKQIVDVDGVRIIRVNDILLGEIEGKFCVVGVDVSTKGIFRRLGFWKYLGELIPILEEHIIPWQYVEPLNSGSCELHVKCKMDKMVDLHPADIADMMNDLSLDERVFLFNSIDKKKAAETLIVSHPDIKRSVFKAMSSKNLAEILESMSYSEAAAVLTLMPSIRNEEVLKKMKKESAYHIQKILSYEKSTAGSIMSTEFLTIPDSFTVSQTIAFLRKKMPKPSKIHYFYVSDKEGNLVGILSLRDLVIGDKNAKVSAILRKNLITLDVQTPLDEAFNLLNKYKLLALPVVSKAGAIVGVIRISDALNALLPLGIKKQRIPSKYRRKRKQNAKIKH
ncbi:MAG: CBS domain-containing protein [archaeon]